MPLAKNFFHGKPAEKVFSVGRSSVICAGEIIPLALFLLGERLAAVPQQCVKCTDILSCIDNHCLAKIAKNIQGSWMNTGL